MQTKAPIAPSEILEPPTGLQSPASGIQGPEAEARLLLSRHQDPVPDDANRDAVSTRLMDLFRRTSGEEIFDCLVRLSTPQLLQRVRAKTRYLGASIDPQEILQDVIINIYRYPDRFDARRPGAFRAWSSTIVDNTIRRHLRKERVGPDVMLRPAEILAQEPDCSQPDPGVHAIQSETCEHVLEAYRLFLLFYLEAFQKLSERERFVLQMVEVRRMRYAPLAAILGIRPEALKMVVFRARRRIAERISAMMPGPKRSHPKPERTVRRPALAMAC